jgi:hypothetical protein
LRQHNRLTASRSSLRDTSRHSWSLRTLRFALRHLRRLRLHVHSFHVSLTRCNGSRNGNFLLSLLFLLIICKPEVSVHGCHHGRAQGSARASQPDFLLFIVVIRSITALNRLFDGAHEVQQIIPMAERLLRAASPTGGGLLHGNTAVLLLLCAVKLVTEGTGGSVYITSIARTLRLMHAQRRRSRLNRGALPRHGRLLRGARLDRRSNSFRLTFRLTNRDSGLRLRQRFRLRSRHKRLRNRLLITPGRRRRKKLRLNFSSPHGLVVETGLPIRLFILILA